ncbi:MAG TPA: double-cubane-cluster-containing anaerobic reductase [Planctomycetota bacterium]|nr:double-cubane-cluster-containing anaerobic reductase [Planctomycetota bacterium]
MIENCLKYAKKAKKQGKPIVGIFCEYTPREIIMAANAVPVCMCGGSNQTISAAEQDLPANLCPLIKSSYGYAKLKCNPFLEMSDLLVGETTCDGKKKMFEILGQTRPMYILELPQKVDDKQAFEHWKQELVKFKKYLEKKFRTTITNKRLKDAIKVMNQERQLRRRIAELAKSNPPLLTGLDILNAKSLIAGIPEDFKVYEEIISSARRNGSKGDVRPRILVTGVPMPHEAEKVMRIIEDVGGAVVAQENCTGLRPIEADVREDIDPIQALAEKYFYLPCSVMTPNTRRLQALDRLIKQYQPQAVIELIWQGCLTYDVESYFIRKHIKGKHRLPYLKIETNYSPSDSGQLKSRIQALLEMID